MDQVVTLPKQADIAALHSQIEWGAGGRVIVEVPRAARALDGVHEQRLLRRWAESAGLQVALVTEDPGIREIAAEVGIPLFASLRRAQQTRWEWDARQEGALQTPVEIDPANLPPQSTPPPLSTFHPRQLLFTIPVFFLATLLLIIAAALLVPTATVRIAPAPIALYNTSSITLDLAATLTDLENTTIPALLVTRPISGTGILATTRTQDAPATRATGIVNFINLAGIQAIIPKGTVVETSSGVTVRFATQVSATLPAGYGSRAQVPVEAVDLGPVGNVKAYQINFIEGPLAGVARVVNGTSLSGGAVKPVHVVSKDDKPKLRQQLLAQLTQVAIQHLSDENDGLYIVPDSVKLTVSNETFDHLVDDPTDTLSMHIEANARGIAASHKRLADFADSVLRSEMTSGYSMLPNTLSFQIDPASRLVDGQYVIKVRSVAFTMPRIDQSQLVKQLQGLTPAQATELLTKQVVQAHPPEIQINPAWWTHLPLFGFRIAMFVDQPLP